MSPTLKKIVFRTTVLRFEHKKHEGSTRSKKCFFETTVTQFWTWHVPNGSVGANSGPVAEMPKSRSSGRTWRTPTPNPKPFATLWEQFPLWKGLAT